MTRRRFLALMGAGAALAALAGCEESGGRSVAKRTSAKLMLDWVPNTNHTGLYVARENGFFEDENLDFEIIEPAEGGGPQVVGAGKVEFGIGFQEFMTPARLEGIPVVSIAAIIQHNTSGFASHADRGITRPRDFEGKTYGGFGSPLELAFLRTMMEADGADHESLKTVDAGAADFLTIIQRDVDLYWIFFAWQGVKAGLEGIEINTVFLRDWGVPDYYTPLLMTNESLIENNPDVVAGTVAAIARGYEFAIENPADAAEILVAAAPETDAELVGPSQDWLSPQYQAEASQWGYQDPGIWQQMSEWMVDNELVEELLDWESAFSNDFLPKR
ncbi:MAG: ABC transporter substrate-binding protein [Chloroflexi bacterium]|nr:ABC transporter substrate-binding protein [Chloroflexota bacterium]MCY3937958.1 ABC transporter substrate-binding protein [Chloroflexota bacterium]